MVVEATLAQPGQHFIEEYFLTRADLPGFKKGMRLVSRDEQRHIGFGVKTLDWCFEESNECKAAVEELLLEVMPYTSSVFIPPAWNMDYVHVWGFELEDILTFGLKSIDSKWRAAGHPIQAMAHVFPFDFDLGPEQWANELVVLLRNGLLGQEKPKATLQSQRLFMELFARLIDSGAPKLTLQWRFSDAPDWYLEISDRARPHLGQTANPDLVISTSWERWVNVTAKGASPARAVLERKLRVRGNPLLWRKLIKSLPR
jgi:hypothetical protein